MFLWPFVMQIVIKAEDTDSAHFVATYNHPCVLQSYGSLRLHRMRETTAHAMPIRTCAGTTGDGSNTFFNKMLLLWPAVVLWGCGTAVGELPPYFITRAARRTGARPGRAPCGGGSSVLYALTQH